jgi:hypothetical protein
VKKPSLPPLPETRTVALSIKIKKSTAVALERAVKVTARSKASLVETVVEQWLRDNGFLK